MVHIYNGILLSWKKDWTFIICSSVDELGIVPNGISQTKTKTVWYHLYMESKKLQQTNEWNIK